MNAGKKITFQDKNYLLVKKRQYDPVYIYASEDKDRILRIGPRDILKKEVELQKFLVDEGFPAAKVLDEGDFDGENYFFTEVSLGERSFIDIFIQDCFEWGEISDEHFNQFVSIIEAYVKVQAHTRKPGFEPSDVRKIFMIDEVISDFPELEGKLEAYFQSFLDHFKAWPSVLIHADFNAYNIMPEGIIDFEESAWGPFGFDLCVNILHPYGWSVSKSEKQIKYKFTELQIARYFDHMDQLALKLGLPAISEHAAEFYIGRMIFHAACIKEFPIIRELRLKRLNELLDVYLERGDVLAAIKRPM